MATNIQQVNEFESGANPAEAWRLWREDFEDYILAAFYGEKSEGTKLALFRHVCGNELKTQYRTYNFQPVAPATEVTLKQVLDELGNYYGGYKSEIFASYVFLEACQKPGEKFDEFLRTLRRAVIDCNYDTLADRMIRDKIVQGLNDKPLQVRLLRESRQKDLSLKDVVEACRSAELSQAQSNVMNQSVKPTTVDAMTKGTNRWNKKWRRQLLQRK